MQNINTDTMTIGFTPINPKVTAMKYTAVIAGDYNDGDYVYNTVTITPEEFTLGGYGEALLVIQNLGSLRDVDIELFVENFFAPIDLTEDKIECIADLVAEMTPSGNPDATEVHSLEIDSLIFTDTNNNQHKVVLKKQ